MLIIILIYDSGFKYWNIALHIKYVSLDMNAWLGVLFIFAEGE